MGSAGMVVKIDELPKNMIMWTVEESEMNVMKFKYKRCLATVGCGTTTVKNTEKPWSTVYRIEPNGSDDMDEEESIFLMRFLKNYFTNLGYDHGYSFGETAIIKGILKKSQVKERETGTGEIYIIKDFKNAMAEA